MTYVFDYDWVFEYWPVLLKGIGITVPPSYAEHVAARFPKLIDRLAWLDQRIGALPLIRNMADCVLLEFERTAETGGDVTQM